MKRRNFIKAMLAAPAALAMPFSGKNKVYGAIEPEIAAELKRRQKDFPPFHAGLTRMPSGKFYPETLLCFCGHEFHLHLAMQNGDILGCSGCERRVQIHIIE